MATITQYDRTQVQFKPMEWQFDETKWGTDPSFLRCFFFMILTVGFLPAFQLISQPSTFLYCGPLNEASLSSTSSVTVYLRNAK
jgi:hypothetical protein